MTDREQLLVDLLYAAISKADAIQAELELGAELRKDYVNDWTHAGEALEALKVKYDAVLGANTNLAQQLKVAKGWEQEKQSITEYNEALIEKYEEIEGEHAQTLTELRAEKEKVKMLCAEVDNERRIRRQ